MSADQAEEVLYLHLPAGADLPSIPPAPCRVVVLIEQDVTREWQDLVSRWIVEIGCLFMMAWGLNCSSWDDSVDWANLEAWNFDEIPDEHFVLTTWHDGAPMSDAFEVCRLNAFHPTIALPRAIILDIVETSREVEIRARYARCLDDLEGSPPQTAKSRLTEWFNRTIKRA